MSEYYLTHERLVFGVSVLDVWHKRALKEKRLVAHVAPKAAFSRMHDEVRVQTVLGRKRLAANFANEHLRPRSGRMQQSFMLVQVRFGWEELGTDVASEWTFVRVRPYVSNQSRFQVERFGTLGAFVRLLPSRMFGLEVLSEGARFHVGVAA